MTSIDSMVQRLQQRTIRRSTKNDVDRVLEIWRDAVDATHDFLSQEDRVAIEAEVVSFLPDAPLWVVVDEHNKPLGWMLLDEDRMEALFIDPVSRGEGVGRALVQHALSLRSPIFTDVNEQNLQAVGFYEHLGFVPIGRSERDGQGRVYPLIHLRSAS
ncbi:acetyltransferase [Terriglobus sp. TAA 43]|uniref:acetyltransferase n=1 Tax=Terriglobus sp. TAA 43 TaxID=278961 RepID=UPI000AA98E13|nr:acetyltransferase [Terriglobus sp. TAA 43]